MKNNIRVMFSIGFRDYFYENFKELFFEIVDVSDKQNYWISVEF